MEPLVPPHAVGLVGVMLLGVDGVSIAITLIVAGRDSHAPVLLVTLTEYEPAAIGVSVAVLTVFDTKPAFAAFDTDQLYVDPGLFVTDKLTVDPKQTGLGSAIKLTGAVGLLITSNDTGSLSSVQAFGPVTVYSLFTLYVAGPQFETV